jgi:hypothetical protein
VLRSETSKQTRHLLSRAIIKGNSRSPDSKDVSGFGVGCRRCRSRRQCSSRSPPYTFAPLQSFLAVTYTQKLVKMVSFDAAKEFLKAQHLAPLLSEVQQQLITLNKWSTVGQALQVRDPLCVRAPVARGEPVWKARDGVSRCDEPFSAHSMAITHKSSDKLTFRSASWTGRRSDPLVMLSSAVACLLHHRLWAAATSSARPCLTRMASTSAACL